MSYCISVKLNKPISREEIKQMLKDSFPDRLLPFGVSDQEWGFPCQMDVLKERKEEDKKEIKLHAAYGTDFRDFLICTISGVCKKGYKVVDLDFDL